MKILYIGEPQTYHEYLQGSVPSHWLYGTCEMEQDGHEVIWEKEKTGLLNDWVLIHKYHPEIVFIPNLNLRNHLIILLCKAIGVYRSPIYAYLHHGKKVKKGICFRFYRLLLNRGITHIFFLSKKSMSETIASGLVDADKCSVPGWGGDRLFFDKITTSDQGPFVSTGKENRDFDILIEAFRRTGAPLIIMTAKTHADNNYENIVEKCKNIMNIKVVITENTSNVYPQMLEAMAGAKALVCPLRQDRLNYCVGLSSISDAEGLNKQLIITQNPYHDPDRSGRFHLVESIDDWIKAIRQINETGPQLQSVDTPNSMQLAYEHMKSIMF